MPRYGEDEILLPLVERGQPDDGDDDDAAVGDRPSDNPPLIRKRSADLLFRLRAQPPWVLVTCLSGAWLLFFASIMAAASVEPWVPVVYSEHTKRTLLAVCVVTTLLAVSMTAVVCSTFTALHKADKQQVASAQLGGASAAALVVFAVALLVLGRSESCADPLPVRVFIGEPGTRAFDADGVVRASVFLPRGHGTKAMMQHVLELQLRADNRQSHMHWADDIADATYTVDYNLASGSASSSSDVTATFTLDHSMNITSPRFDPIIIDTRLSDQTGARILERVGAARRCSILKLCASRFVLGSSDQRGIARVLFPLGLLMHDFAIESRC